MKRIILFFACALLLFSACGEQTRATVSGISIDAPAATPRPTTSQGTPITDGASLPLVSMRETPKSTCFSSVGYDIGTETLFVVFRDSGAKYAYDEVPAAVYRALCNAESMGGYYNKNIKGQYDCTKVEE